MTTTMLAPIKRRLQAMGFSLRLALSLKWQQLRQSSNPCREVRESTVFALDEKLHFRIFQNTVSVLEEHDNWIFFAGPIWLRNRIAPLRILYDHIFRRRLQMSAFGQEWFPFLYPPNLASIDFLIGTFEQRADVPILDVGCGIGGFGVYVASLGFPTWLYDSGAQLSKTTLHKFWTLFDLNERLIHEWKSVRKLPVSVVNCIGMSLYWDGSSMLDDIVANHAITYLLLDTEYNNPFAIPEFNIHAYYPGLIWVLKRK